VAVGLAGARARRAQRPGGGTPDRDHLTSLGGLAALSLDALSSVAYGPEAIVLVLATAGVGAIGTMLPVTLVIVGLLAVLVVSYGQVIAVHPDGGGAYAVAKADLGRWVSLLAAASLVVDYVLTVAVSLAAGAASLGSAFPSLAHHLLGVSLIGLVGLTAVNLRGVAESARALMAPTALFIAAILGVIVVGLVRGHPLTLVGRVEPVHATAALGVLLVLKAFAAGCSALTGVEAIANGVPTFREPRVRRAQVTELMSLLARDNRLPHLFGLRAEHPVYRYGVVALALLAGLLLVIVGADTNRLIPLFAIGVFVGFTISQVGLVTHWSRTRPPRWLPRAAVNGTGAVLTAGATVIFLASKFTEGAWIVVVAVPLMVILFARIESYYQRVGVQLGIGRTPPRPVAAGRSLVIVPVGDVNRLATHALRAALALGDEVVAVTVGGDPANEAAFQEKWDRWKPGVRLDVLPSPKRSVVRPIVDYVNAAAGSGRQIAVLIPEVEPRRRRYQILHNQRGLVLATVLRAQTDVVVCTLPLRLDGSPDG
jgi:amino acid transporter